MAIRMAMIFVRDLAGMTAFYRDVMGLAVKAESAGWVEFEGFGLHGVEGDWEVGPVREETPIKLVFDGDVQRASEAARALPGMGELPLHFHASPEMTEVATFAALFEPKLVSLTLSKSQ